MVNAVFRRRAYSPGNAQDFTCHHFRGATARMALELKQQLKLSQQLLMTPQLQQAIKLLQLSRLELMETVQRELLENPFLEEAEEPVRPSLKPAPRTATQYTTRRRPARRTGRIIWANCPARPSWPERGNTSCPRKSAVWRPGTPLTRRLKPISCGSSGCRPCRNGKKK